MQLNESAVAILTLCDGSRSREEIVAHVTSTSLAAGDTQPVAFVHGFQRGLEVAAAIALAGAVVAVVSMRGHREQLRAPSDEPAFQEAA